MPQVVVAAGISAGISTALATEAAILASGSFLGFAAQTAASFFARSFVTTLVLGALSQALAKKPSMSGLGGQSVTGRSPIGPHKVIYGTSRVGGNIVYMNTTEDNKYLHMVIAIAGHEIDSFEAFYANDQEITLVSNFSDSNSDYGNKIRVLYKLGTDTQAAFSELVSETSGLSGEWTSNHRVRGSALAYIRLEYDQDKFPDGIPNFTFKVRGKKVYDPRTGNTVYSNNAALCLNDYLTNTRYGLGCNYATEIDETALIAAANICDEQVTLADASTQNRYECNGVVSTSNTPESVINMLLTSMAGKAVWSSGKWRILAGAYDAPALSFNEDDLRAGFSVSTLVSRRENFNSVYGVFLSEDGVNGGLPYVMADFPPIISSTFIAADGEEIKKNIELPFTTNSVMAQRLAKIELLKARQQITLTLPIKLKGMKANVGDVVNVSNVRLGWTDKKFEVVSMNMALGESIGVDLELREISTDVYDWSTSEEQAFDPAPNTSLPNAFSVAAPASFTYSTAQYEIDGGVIIRDVTLYWSASTDGFIDYYEVEINKSGSPAWHSARTKNTSMYFEGVITGLYNVKIYAVNTSGVRSAALIGNALINADTTAPSAPSGLTITSNGFRSAYLKWTNPSDKDYFQTIVYASLTNDSNAAVEVGRVSGTSITYSGLPDNTTWYVWLKAIDYSGNQSGFNTSRYAGVSFSTNSDVYTDISNVQGDVSTLQTDVTTVEGNVSTLQTDVTSVQGDVSTLQTDVTAVEGDVSTLQSNVVTINGQIVTINSDLSTLETSVSNKLEASTSYVLTGVVQPTNTGGVRAGTISWNSTTGALTGGSGIAMTEYGIIGAQAGVSKFTIDTNGNATFAGDVNTAGDGVFEGQNPSSAYIWYGFTPYAIDYSVYGKGTTGTAGRVRTGVYGYAYNASAAFSIGLTGYGPGSSGFGVFGQGGAAGGYFAATSSTGYGLVVTTYNGTTSYTALNITAGKFAWGAYTWSMPTGSSSQFMRADGSWAAPSHTYTANSGSATGTTSVSLLGSTSTGIAGAYVGTSGSGSTVTWTVQTTSPSDRRLKENIADCTFGLDFVNALQPKSYQLKADERHQTGFGFIADEVAAIDDVYGTSLVYREENWQVGEEIGFDTIHYPSYIPILVKAIQELSAENSSLKARIEALESK